MSFTCLISLNKIIVALRAVGYSDSEIVEDLLDRCDYARLRLDDIAGAN